jgi:DNA-binding transcriptional ArsR family regulator
MTAQSAHPAHLEPLVHPACEDLELLSVLRALADPTRLEIVRILASDPVGRRACGSFGLDATKQNLSHHFRVLREAGVTRAQDEGRNRLTSLRRDDLDARFPGLLAAVLGAASETANANR